MSNACCISSTINIHFPTRKDIEVKNVSILTVPKSVDRHKNNK